MNRKAIVLAIVAAAACGKPSQLGSKSSHEETGAPVSNCVNDADCGDGARCISGGSPGECSYATTAFDEDGRKLPLDPPEPSHIIARYHAIGLQIYVKGSDGWKLDRPQADLFDWNWTGIVGIHSKGPVWKVDDVGSVTGVKKVSVTNEGAVDLLLLAAKEGNGKFARVSYIQRLNTSGGQPCDPSDEDLCGCESRDNGELECSYSADYIFSAPGADARADGGPSGSTCSADLDCALDLNCLQGICDVASTEGKLRNGQSCQTSDECYSDRCEPNVNGDLECVGPQGYDTGGDPTFNQ